MLPLRLTIFCSAHAIARWKVADALHKPNGILRHSKSPNSQAKAVLWRSAFRKRNLPEGPGKIYTSVDLCIAQSRQAFVDAGQGVGILDGYFV